MSVAAATEASATPTPTPVPRAASLEQAVQDAITQWKDPLGGALEYGVVVHNLDTGDRFAVNEHTNVQTASVYKMFVMLAVYYDISQGNLTLDTPITLTPDAADAEEDGSLIVPIGQSLPVRDLLEYMITESNNTAALMLMLQVKIPRLREIVADYGMTESDLSDSFNFQATPADLDTFLTALGNHKLLGDPYDQNMIDLMSRDKIRDRIPALLPPDTKVANKIGNLSNITNDAGIIYLPNGQRLVVAVMERNFADAQASYKFISEISLAAYNYYAP